MPDKPKRRRGRQAQLDGILEQVRAAITPQLKYATAVRVIVIRERADEDEDERLAEVYARLGGGTPKPATEPDAERRLL